MINVGNVHPTLICPDCGSGMILRENPNQLDGNRRAKMFYSCASWSKTRCKGSVGAHPNGAPVGIPTGAKGKAARIETHEVMAAWMKRKNLNKAQAYAALERYYKKPIHIGHLDITGCDEVQRFMLND